MSKLDNRDMLYKGLKMLNIDSKREKVEKLFAFKDIMLEWNEKINLTSITDEREVFIKHFLDSATCIATGHIKKGMDVIDVGTGAGFPGVPVKILEDGIKITLLDSLKKRINYLGEVVEKLKLKDVELVHGRAEEAGKNKRYRENYDIVLSRAVAAMNILCEYCLPFAKVGGYFLCQKGPEIKDELKEAENAVKELGGELAEIIPYELPYSDITHNIIIIRKAVQTPTKYPRKPGKPSASPIK